MVTLLGRGEGATLVTTLTATAEAKGLFKQVWATNGAGVLSDKELDDANRENKVRVTLQLTRLVVSHRSVSRVEKNNPVKCRNFFGKILYLNCIKKKSDKKQKKKIR